MFKIRGWLLLLALLLALWEPLVLALVASSLLGRFADEPLAALVLSLRLLATAVGLAAGLALLTARPHSIRLAKAALALLTITALFVYLTPWFPRNHPRSLSVPLAVVAVACNTAWFIFLARSKQARDIEAGAPAHSHDRAIDGGDPGRSGS